MLYTAKEAREADLPLAYTGRLLVCRGLLHRFRHGFHPVGVAEGAQLREGQFHVPVSRVRRHQDRFDSFFHLFRKEPGRAGLA